MTTEDMKNEVSANDLSDEQLDEVVGGLIHQNGAGKWEVLSDLDRSVIQTLDSKMAAIAYAKRIGVSTKRV